MALLEIDNLHLSMRSFEGRARVLNGITLSVDRGEIWGLVGETGCGKSLTGLSVSRLVATPPASYDRGSIRFDGRDVLTLDEAAMRRLRGRHIGMVFQDPTTNLNPVFTIGTQMIDVVRHAASLNPDLLGATQGRARSAAARRLAAEMLGRVGIPDPEARLDAYPHQFSGGMRQRVLIAMALIGRPELLIADEPTTALDVSVQAQILRLIHDLVTEYRLAVLMITHNLGVVAQICSHVAVMYAGNIVESGTTRAVLKTPSHPYTKALLAAMPSAHAARGTLAGIAGQVPNLLVPPPGCRFAPRCALVRPECATLPELTGPATHRVACVAA